MLKNVRNRTMGAAVTPPLRPTVDPVPIDRQVVEVKELRERCLACGTLVCMRRGPCRDGVQYVRCPKCQARHAQYRDSDLHRLVHERPDAEPV
jgi:hypothetical protein